MLQIVFAIKTSEARSFDSCASRLIAYNAPAEPLFLEPLFIPYPSLTLIQALFAGTARRTRAETPASSGSRLPRLIAELLHMCLLRDVRCRPFRSEWSTAQHKFCWRYLCRDRRHRP